MNNNFDNNQFQNFDNNNQMPDMAQVSQLDNDRQLLNESSGGTPISELRKRAPQQNYNHQNHPNHQNYSNHPTFSNQDQIIDQRHLIQHNKNSPNRKQTKKKSNKNVPTNEHTKTRQKIRRLVSDINRSLDDYAPSKNHNTDSDRGSINDDINNNDIDDMEKVDEILDKSKCEANNSLYNQYVPNWLKEPLLIIVLYVILSQGFVRRTLGEYITYINPQPDGTIPLIGYIIYGTILAVLFVIFKYILIG